MKKTIALSFITLSCLYADISDNFTSMQGYTGFINIPTADIQEYGEIDFAYSNQVSISRWVSPDERDEFKPSDYFVNIGLLPYVEFGGRVSDIKAGKKDLSPNIKVKLPIKKYVSDYLPDLAVGFQDFGGETGDYRSKYVVISDTVKKLQYSLGYATDSVRMDGVFYGFSYKFNKYISVLAENDTKENHVGLRLNSANLFKTSKLSFVVKRNMDYSADRYSIGLNFKFVLGDEKKYAVKTDLTENTLVDNVINLYKTPQYQKSMKKAESRKLVLPKKTIYDLKKELTDLGFENIDIGEYYNKVFVAFENRVYNKNELDALNKVLHILSTYPQYQRFNIVLKKSDLKIKTLDGSLKYYRDCLKDYNLFNITQFKRTLIVADDFVNPKIYKIKNANSGRFKTRVEFAPKLKSFLATEVGLYEYYLGLDSTFSWNLYNGLDLSLTYRIPVSYSDELDPKTGVYKSSYESSHLENAFLHYIFKWNSLTNIASAGMYKKDYYGFLNESSLYFDTNSIKYKFGYFEHKDYDINFDSRDINLLTFEHYISSIDSIISLRGGKYWGQDTGADVEFKKFFGDTMIYLFAQQSTRTLKNGSDETNKYVGIGFEIPLVPKKITNHKYYQITGTNAFNHKIKSVIDKEENIVVPGQLYVPSTYDSGKYLYNRDRLSKSYIEKHIERLVF